MLGSFKNARAKILFFIVKYANLWGLCCRRRRAPREELIVFAKQIWTTAIRRSLGQRFRIQTTSFPGSLFFISLERKRKKARKKRIGRMKRTTRFIFLKTGQTSFSYSSKQATSIQCNNCSFQTCHLITLRWKEPRWVKKSKGTEKLKNPVIFLVVT